MISAFNRAGLIAGILHGLLAQTLPADEIIVVNDGSTEDAWEVMPSFGPLMKAIHRAGGGPAAARNTGLEDSAALLVRIWCGTSPGTLQQSRRLDPIKP
jgi:glycosyltransferase involved in cell wall biosynthesis